MTKKIFALFVLALYVFPMAALADDTSQLLSPLSLLFSEVGSYETSENEWIEVYNAGETEVDLTTWKFLEENTNHGIKATTSGNTVAAHSIAVIANNSDAYKITHPEYTGPLFDSTWSGLKLEGEPVALKDPEGVLHDELTYGAATSGSVERVIDKMTGAASEWIARSEGNTLGTLYVAAQIVETPVSITSDVATTDSNSSSSTASPQPILTPPSPQIPLSSSPLPHAIIQIQSGQLEAEGSTSVNFDGRASFDLNNNALTYLWDFGDGTTSDSANPGTHKFEKPGIYNVQLTVRNTMRFISTANEEVIVHEKASVPATVIGTSTKASTLSPIPKSISIMPASSPAPTQAPMYIVAYLSLDQGLANGEKPLLAMATPTQATTAVSTSPISISELYPAPSKGGEEWIELENKGSSKVDVSGWMLADESKTSKPYILPVRSFIASHGLMLIKKSASKINLNNGEDSVFLADSNGGLIDQISYINSPAEKSYVHTETDEWQWTSHTTPGKQNPPMEKVTATVTKKISEAKREIKVDDSLDETEAVMDIPESVMAAPLADVILDEGSRIDATVQPMPNNTYEAVHINDVQIPTKEKPAISWTLVIGIGASALILGWQMPNIVARIRDWVEAEKLKSM